VKVSVSLFARFREAAGCDRLEVDVPDGATVEEVWAAVSAAHPSLARYRPHALFAVANEYVTASRRVHPGEEVAFFPPVSGGSRVPGDG
jgi:molybdopterin synthase catalytic subunit